MPRAKSIDKLHRDKREGRHWENKEGPLSPGNTNKEKQKWD